MNMHARTSRHVRATVLLFVVALLGSGCARMNSIHRTDHIGRKGNLILTTDAKQRSTFVMPVDYQRVATAVGTQEKARAIYRICAQPPPDVFSAIASTQGLKAAFGQDKARSDASAEWQQVINENAATIGYTQTVNVLRDMMYRNCERYMSGAVDEAEFIVQAARDQRAIVHVLAIEQLTGAARTQSAALVSAARAASTGVTGDAVLALDRARGETTKARASANAAKADAEKLEPVGACVHGKDAYADSGKTADEIKAKQEACDKAKAASNAAEDAAAHYAALKDAIDRQTAMSSDANGTLMQIADNAKSSAQFTASAVESIVRMNNDFDEIQMTCVTLFRNYSRHADKFPGKDARNGQYDANASKYAQFADKCLAYLDPKIALEISENRLSTLNNDLESLLRMQDIDALNASIQRQQAAIDPLADRVWNTIVDNGVVSDKKLAALEQKANVRINAKIRVRMIAAQDRNAFIVEFSRLIPSTRTALANSAGQ